MGYYFTNILEITTSSLSLDYINPKNKKRLDLIMKLHKMGKSNKEIVEMLKIKEIKRRNKNDDYSVKDVIMCLKNLPSFDCFTLMNCTSLKPFVIIFNL